MGLNKYIMWFSSYEGTIQKLVHALAFRTVFLMNQRTIADATLHTSSLIKKQNKQKNKQKQNKKHKTKTKQTKQNKTNKQTNKQNKTLYNYKSRVYSGVEYIGIFFIDFKLQY